MSKLTSPEMSAKEKRFLELMSKVQGKRNQYIKEAETHIDGNGREKVQYYTPYLRKTKGWRYLDEAVILTSEMLPQWIEAEEDFYSFLEREEVQDLGIEAVLVGSLAVGLPQEGSDMEMLITSGRFRELRDALINLEEGQDFDSIYQEFDSLKKILVEIRNKFITDKKGNCDTCTILNDVYGYDLQVLVGLEGLMAF